MTEGQYKLRVALEELDSNEWKSTSSDDEFVKQFQEKVKKRKEISKKNTTLDPIQETQQKILNNIVNNKEQK